MTRRDPLIIALAGPAGAGKDTAAHHLVAEHGFERYAFADPIRAMLERLLVEADIDCAWLYERELKEHPIPGLGISARTLMQTLGTEWGRKLRDDMWTHMADRTLGLHDLPNSAPVHDRLVISDLRFPNEADWVRRHNGFVVRITGRGGLASTHISEALIDQTQPWREVDNSGGLDYLHDQLAELVGAAERAPLNISPESVAP